MKSKPHKGTSNIFKIFAASFITGRSEPEPIMIPTCGVTALRKENINVIRM
jgi:hypothetical protein